MLRNLVFCSDIEDDMATFKISVYEEDVYLAMVVSFLSAFQMNMIGFRKIVQIRRAVLWVC